MNFWRGRNQQFVNLRLNVRNKMNSGLFLYSFCCWLFNWFLFIYLQEFHLFQIKIFFLHISLRNIIIKVLFFILNIHFHPQKHNSSILFYNMNHTFFEKIHNPFIIVDLSTYHLTPYVFFHSFMFFPHNFAASYLV